ncbi:MAG TPA: ribose-phosphate diphosphokinase [Burkholderiaceae bacterium]|nr:ribose-phosphate diphosphokinase [Burkholderiaceae bacterium]
MQIYGLDPEPEFARALAARLDREPSPLEARRFADGEGKLRPLVDPRGADAYVVQGLHGGPQDSPHDKLARLLMFIATLRDHGAARVTAVVPYLAYARKDRQTHPFDPVNLRYVAMLFEAVGTAQLMTLEVHNVAAFQNAFRCPTWHLPAQHAFGDEARRLAGDGPLAVASPDPGGVKRAQLWRESLEGDLRRPVGFAMVDKRRHEGVVSGIAGVAGDVREATVILVDDLIASGETMQRAAAALVACGARRVVACAAHGLFVEPAEQVLLDENIAEIVVSDAVPTFRVARGSPLRRKLRVVSCVDLFATAIRRSHEALRR